MSIYRGAGGAGDAVADSASEALLIRALSIEVQEDANAAAASAAAASASEAAAETSASNAATYASSAYSSAAAATTSSTNAADSATAAQTAETAAELAETNAETAQAAAEDAQLAAETAKTAAELAETNAETAETNAETAETNAAASASAASGSASAAATSATNASNSASAASTSATNASNSASAASTSATNAANSATSAATSASTATTQAGVATTQATNAGSSATSAAGSATSAASSLLSVQQIFDNFDDIYLGAKASDPTVDNDGDPLNAGDIYFNTTESEIRFYNGTAWERPEYAASQSALAALTSANNASSSATAASGSASSASTSATNAANSASSASTSATNASNSATAASTSASTATTQATNAASSASAASTSETNASNSASAASTSASNASTSATNAANSATAAATSETNAAASYDAFDDRYLGSKSSAPTLDNDGNTLLVGALYFNTVDNSMKVWNGTAWLDAYASLSGALIDTNNLSDLTNTTTARSNLGVAIGTNVQAWDADLDTWATKTAPSGTVVGTSDTQTLTNKTLTNPTINGFTGNTSIVNLGSGQFYKDTSGNVGIGTSSPLAPLHVVTTETSTAAFGNVISTFRSSGAGRDASVQFSDGTNTGNIGQLSGNLILGTGGTERMRINASGAVTLKNSITTGPYIRGDSISVANNSTISITSAEAGAAIVCVYNRGSGSGGVFFVTFSSAAIKIAGDGEATDTGSTFSVYKSASSHTATFKNRSGATALFAVAVYSAKAEQ